MIRKFFRGFYYALKGLRYVFQSQLNFRIHTFSVLTVILAAFCLRLDTADCLWLTVAVSMVLIAELLNTALEKLIDMISPGYNKDAGIVKDIAAGLVLVAAIAALIIGAFIFVPKLR